MREISETDVRRLHIRTVRYPTTSRPHDVRRTTTTFGRAMLNACVVCEEHSARHNLNAQPRLSAARSEHEMAKMPRAPPFKFCLSALLCLIFHPCSPGGLHSDPCADLYSTPCDGVDTSNKLCAAAQGLSEHLPLLTLLFTRSLARSLGGPGRTRAPNFGPEACWVEISHSALHGFSHVASSHPLHPLIRACTSSFRAFRARCTAHGSRSGQGEGEGCERDRGGETLLTRLEHRRWLRIEPII